MLFFSFPFFCFLSLMKQLYTLISFYCDFLSWRLGQCTFPLLSASFSSLSLSLSLLPLSLPSLCLFLLFPLSAQCHGILGKSSSKLGRMAKPNVLVLSSYPTLPKYLSFIHHPTIITYTRRYFDFACTRFHHVLAFKKLS